MIAGVCGGLGEYLNIDPTVVRIIFVLLTLPGGVPGPLVYLVLWFVMPEE
jgi:phage shock protein C